jgi:hypothetical protein
MPTAHDTPRTDHNRSRRALREAVHSRPPDHRSIQEILQWLSSGAPQQQILDDYPQLDPDDLLAMYAYAAELAAGAGDSPDAALRCRARNGVIR